MMHSTREQTIAELFETMNALKRAMAARLQAAARTCALPRAQADMLIAIRHLQPTSSKDLAAHLYLTPGAVSQVVEELQGQQLLRRQTDPTDRRKQVLQLSEKGSNALEEMEASRRTLMEAIFQELSEEDLHIWLRVQQKMLAHLQAEPSQ